MSIEELLGPLNPVEQRNAPPALFVAGDRALLRREPRVAIVGSRDATQEGLEDASHVAAELVRRAGAVIVSGLARGIDTAAHRSAMAAGGRTIAVLGTPLESFSLAGNRDLQREIMALHLAVSQFPSRTVIRKANFPARNRTMALICQASIIIEAGDGSGTLSQGWEALRLGRPLFIRERILDRGLEWPRSMVQYGAIVLGDDLSPVLESIPTAVDAAADALL